MKGKGWIWFFNAVLWGYLLGLLVIAIWVRQ